MRETLAYDAHVAESVGVTLPLGFGVDVIEVTHRRYDSSMSRAIASEFVGNQPPRLTALAFQQATEEAFGRTLIATALYEKIKHIAILIDGTPQKSAVRPEA